MKKSHWLILGIAAAALLLFYLPTHDAGFVTDFTGLAERIETHGSAGILSSFGFPALQPVTSICYFLFYRYFAVYGWGWYLASSLVHAGNGLWLFFLMRRLLADSPGSTQWAVAGFGSLLFVFSPYASEVLVWRVGFHYPLVTCWILAGLWYTLNWLETPDRKKWGVVIGLQIVALLTYELALVIPLFTAGLLLWRSPLNGRKSAALQLLLPQLGLNVLYFVANRLLLGSWIGHYGSAVHLQFPWKDMLANTGRYFFKWIAFSRYWPHPWKEGVALWLSKPPGLLVLSLVILGLFYLLWRGFRRGNAISQLGWSFGLAAYLALLPVLNLYFNYLLHIENDRYGYLAAAFFYPAWMALLSRLPRWLFLSLGFFYFLCSMWLLQKTNSYWAASTAVYRALLHDFDAQGRDTCYLLNLPDNLQGAPMFRDYSGEDGAFADALQYAERKPYGGTLHEVVQYNMVSPADGVQVETDSTGLKVTFNQWGNWWWRRGIGAGNYRDSTFIFHNEGHHFRLEWRQLPTQGAIFYQVGEQWVRMDNLLPGR